MQHLTTWNPFREMDSILSRMQRGFGHDPVLASDTLWAPSVDISESPAEYLIKADLPGLKKEDVKIGIANGVLTVSGERKEEKEHKDATQHRIERSYGSFARSFTLPEDVSADKVTAECKDGVVSIHLPKSEVKKDKSVEIRVQ